MVHSYNEILHGNFNRTNNCNIPWMHEQNNASEKPGIRLWIAWFYVYEVQKQKNESLVTEIKIVATLGKGKD